ncbi:hypothetical protein BS78_02G098700 [Paspalum vaginatum]|nr:hypothetical protein BS78_02G098700 [Paspalum vaginatum]
MHEIQIGADLGSDGGAALGHGARSVVDAPLAGCVSLPYGGPPPFPGDITSIAAALSPATTSMVSSLISLSFFFNFSLICRLTQSLNRESRCEIASHRGGAS